MHAHAMRCGQFGYDLVQRQVALDRQPVPQPTPVGRKLACGMIALRLRNQSAARALLDDHVIHKARRNPEMPRRLAMPVPLLNKGDNPAA